MCVDDKFDHKAQKLYWRAQLIAFITQFLLYMDRIRPFLPIAQQFEVCLVK